MPAAIDIGRDKRRLILDTNVVLDWLCFADPRVAWLDEGIAAGTITVATQDALLAEWRRVLAYPKLGLDEQRQRELVQAYEANSARAEMPKDWSPQNLLLPVGFPRCRDSDDDFFLALAFHLRAFALVSKDKAVLALSKRAAKFGVRIVAPEAMPALLRTGR